MLVWSQSKLLPVLEDDLQGFLNEEIRNSGILDMVCAIRSLESVNKDNGWPWGDVCKLAFKHMTEMAIVNTATKQKGGEWQWRKKSSICDSHSMVLQCADTFLHYKAKRSYRYSDITTSRKIRTVMRKNLNSSQ
jgi:hypothetical protein